MSAVSQVQICSSVLIVDDEPGQLDSLKELMLLADYEVGTATCGNEAIEALAEHHYDTILLDLNMPNGNGFDVIDHVVGNNVHVRYDFHGRGTGQHQHTW